MPLIVIARWASQVIDFIQQIQRSAWRRAVDLRLLTCFTSCWHALLAADKSLFSAVPEEVPLRLNEAYYYMCVLIILYMCPHTATFVSSCYYICVLILLCMFPRSTTYVSSYYYVCVLVLLYMCPHTTMYVSSFYYICVLILLYVSSYYFICVPFLLHI